MREFSSYDLLFPQLPYFYILVIITFNVYFFTVGMDGLTSVLYNLLSIVVKNRSKSRDKQLIGFDLTLVRRSVRASVNVDCPCPVTSFSKTTTKATVYSRVIGSYMDLQPYVLLLRALEFQLLYCLWFAAQES